MIVDNNEEVTTKNEDRKMCSSACDGAMEMYSSECPDACGDGMFIVQTPRSEAPCECET